jgi:hypothetical protein
MSVTAAPVASGVNLSLDAQVAIAPEATYQQALTGRTPIRWWAALRRPALVLLVIAVMVPIMAVQRVTISLVATTAVSWSFVLAIQIVVAVGVIASAPARRVSMLRALDLWFAGHLPYSLWMLMMFAWMGTSTSSSLRLLVISALVPAVWTARIVSAFCRVVLGASRWGAVWRSIVHFVVSWAIGLTYVAWAAGGWFQLF